MELVITETTGKANRIAEVLGEGYLVKVCASPRDDAEALAGVIEGASQADIVYLATDPDREGEALAQAIVEALPAPEQKKARRVALGQLTEAAIREAIRQPRAIDEDLVDAQRAQQAMSRDCFTGIDVLRAHEPAWQIGTDRQQGQVRRSQPVADLAEMLTHAGIAGEVDAVVAALDDEPPPKAAIGVQQIATRPVTCRDTVYADGGSGIGSLPPVEFVVVGGAQTIEGTAETEGHDKHTLLEMPDGCAVEMVVMIMGEKDDVNVGEILK